MKKDIYIIKNRINDKVYIGQTVNPTQRWAQYKSAVKKMPDAQLITKAMRVYGFDNFWMEILEKDVENYDEKEIFYISKYNSLAPNGYNLCAGAAIKSKETLDNIIEDLINNNLTIKQISEKYCLSVGTINELNQGHTYYNPDLNYPIRKSKKYSEEKIKQITYALKYELDKSLKDIAKEYNCDNSFLNDINQGRSFFREYLTYPIRKGKMKYQEEYLPLLIDDLINTSIKQKDLAKKYNISIQTVSDVNVGRTGHQNNIVYPIRGEEERGRTCFTPAELQLIYNDLLNKDLSINQIAKKWGVCSTTIRNINSGKIKKYYNNNIKYPIRK